MKELKNQPCYDKDGNFLGWWSRSVAVLAVTFGIDKDNERYVLASQRGPGTPDPEFVGCWNCCCGYLDFNESTKMAAIRETYEETGIDISDCEFIDMEWIDEPGSDKRQNISHRFLVILSDTIDKYEFSKKNNEKDEVGEIKWIPVSKIDDYKWAFGHNEIIKRFYHMKLKWMF